MDSGSPSAFCALAMTVFASCANALPQRQVVPTTASTSFVTTAFSPALRSVNENQFGVIGLVSAAKLYTVATVRGHRLEPVRLVGLFP